MEVRACLLGRDQTQSPPRFFSFLAKLSVLLLTLLGWRCTLCFWDSGVAEGTLLTPAEELWVSVSLSLQSSLRGSLITAYHDCVQTDTRPGQPTISGEKGRKRDKAGF